MKRSRQKINQEEANPIVIRKDLHEKSFDSEKDSNCSASQGSNNFAGSKETGFYFDADGLLETQQICGNKYVQHITSGSTEFNRQLPVMIDPSMGNISELETGQRSKYERVFDKDLSNVRIHSGPGVNTLNQRLGAKAFTIGSHIFPKNNEFNYSTNYGQNIITHEITHVLQSSDQNLESFLQIADPDSPYEREARENSKRFFSGHGDLTVANANADGNLFLVGEEGAPAETTGTDLLEPLMERATGSSTRDVIEEISEGSSWARIQGSEAVEINRRLGSGDRVSAVNMAWELLLASLPSDITDRITVSYVNDSVGSYGNESVTTRQGADAMALAYVHRKDGCSALSGNEEQRNEQHRQLHNPDEINVMIQIGCTVFSTAPEEQLPTLQSALMHEYTHARQYFERGITSSTRFRPPIQDLEFIDEHYTSTAEANRIEGLAEIEAYASEIEHARASGLSDTFSIEHAINGLWDNYSRYFGGTLENPDRNVAQRVHEAVESGRSMFWNYLHSPRGRIFSRIKTPQEFLEDCPANYAASKIESFIDNYEHIEYVEAGD